MSFIKVSTLVHGAPCGPSHQIRPPTQTPSRTCGVRAVMRWKQGFTDLRNPSRHAAWNRLIQPGWAERHPDPIDTDGSTLLSLQNVRESGGFAVLGVVLWPTLLQHDWRSSLIPAFIPASRQKFVTATDSRFSAQRKRKPLGWSLFRCRSRRSAIWELLAEEISQKISPPLVRKPQNWALAKRLCWMCRKNEGIEDQRTGGKLWLLTEMLV